MNLTFGSDTLRVNQDTVTRRLNICEKDKNMIGYLLKYSTGITIGNKHIRLMIAI